jgi:subtilisin family serine protease
LPDIGGILEDKRSLWSDLNPLGAAEPIFKDHPALLRSSVLALDNLTLAARDTLDMAGFFQVFVSSPQEAATLVDRLLADPDVEYAEAQQRMLPAVRFSETLQTAKLTLDLELPLAPTPNLTAEQRYLQPAPIGIDAMHAWTRPGGRGKAVRIVDIESGWNFGHEDLRENANGVILGGNAESDHGTAVLGIFSGDSNAFGISGIASDAVAMAASVEWGGLKWNAAASIKFAADRLKPGDVILLEMHAPRPGVPNTPDSQKGFVAVEYWMPEFVAIQYAVAKGIHVVEAAGNGGENYDDPIYGTLFSRQARDSGAILVGAGQPPRNPQPRSRIDWSNCGSRVDVQGWGLDIVTTGGLGKGYHDRVDSSDASRCYTQSFGGTSGASPIVVGAVACIGGALAAAGRPQLTPLAMRQLLAETGTSQTDAPKFPAASNNIGPLPNLRAALHRLGL